MKYPVLKGYPPLNSTYYYKLFKNFNRNNIKVYNITLILRVFKKTKLLFLIDLTTREKLFFKRDFVYNEYRIIVENSTYRKIFDTTSRPPSTLFKDF